MPHPLEHKFVLKVQTEKPLTPSQALEKTLDRLIGDLASLEELVKVPGVGILYRMFNIVCRMRLRGFLRLNHHAHGK